MKFSIEKRKNEIQSQEKLQLKKTLKTTLTNARMKKTIPTCASLAEKR